MHTRSRRPTADLPDLAPGVTLVDVDDELGVTPVQALLHLQVVFQVVDHVVDIGQLGHFSRSISEFVLVAAFAAIHSIVGGLRERVGLRILNPTR